MLLWLSRGGCLGVFVNFYCKFDFPTHTRDRSLCTRYISGLLLRAVYKPVDTATDTYDHAAYGRRQRGGHTWVCKERKMSRVSC